jgi:hypothetical protein
MSEERIKLFCGTSPNGEDAEQQMVLEYTARKNSSLPIDIEWMKLSHDPTSHYSGWTTTEWPTPFSGFRWGIPARCDFQGQAIYMDCDMIVLGDLAELWNIPFANDDVSIMGKGGWRFCVSKWNCKAAESWLLPLSRLKKIPTSHQRMFNFLTQVPMLVQNFDRQWNNFDGENDKLEDIKILHYTDMSTQMSHKYSVPRLHNAGIQHWFDGEIRQHRRPDVQHLFDTLYEEALENGYTVEQYIPTEMYGVIDKHSEANYTAANGFDVTRGE